MGCHDEAVELGVDVRTDLIPGVEFDSVQIKLENGSPQNVPVIIKDAFYPSKRIFDYIELDSSAVRLVDVELLDASGQTVSKTVAVIDNREDATLVVSIPRSCVGIDCSNGDVPMACLAGKCVDAKCVTGNEESCPDLECQTKSDCALPSQTCLDVVCEAGSCIYPQGSSCSVQQYCGSETGCTNIECPDTCDDQNPCTTDGCSMGGCSFSPLSDGTPCAGGSCEDGMCLPRTTMDASVDATLDAALDAEIDASVDAPVPSTRVTDGLVALWEFNDGSGNMVVDSVAGAHLTITNADQVTWTAGGLLFDTADTVAAVENTTSITTPCRSSNQLTIETWFTPAAMEYQGPARLVSFSQGVGLQNFVLGLGGNVNQFANTAAFRVRSGDNAPENGLPNFYADNILTTGQKTHVIAVHNLGAESMYADGSLVSTGVRATGFQEWDDSYWLNIGNVRFFGTPRQFLGEIHLVAIYCRALGPDEVTQNFQSGSE